MKQTNLNADLFPDKPAKHVERVGSDLPTTSNGQPQEKAARQPGNEGAEEMRVEAMKAEGKIIVVDWEEVSSRRQMGAGGERKG